MIVLKVLSVLGIVFAVLFVLSLLVYFFNLDMKGAALIMPLFEKHYDRMDRKKKNEKKENQKNKNNEK